MTMVVVLLVAVVLRLWFSLVVGVVGSHFWVIELPVGWFLGSCSANRLSTLSFYSQLIRASKDLLARW